MGANTGHENTGGMACIGVRGEPTFRPAREGAERLKSHACVLEQMPDEEFAAFGVCCEGGAV
jgi:hypothetical protein